ncbi:ABC transporter ATP-binding protein [Micromonospora sp. NBC_01813]|uniref:ABC transporter ATP-binding protein n=1 Tax=Micromonospora sp. NBC_01813 TaxID=2975988 RepID=UPI002DD9AA28|nr:ABC transporter ATP-binding protein [Micromonospora sp. NBC_01813]WSA10780.1 ABC transporter ATP-binding protein [Micromonospora sp. NBC_01813]
MTGVLDFDAVTVHVAGRDLVRDVSITVRRGTIAGILGPNGAGKTTLLRAGYRVVRPHPGDVRLDGTSLPRLRPRALARRLAVVLQERDHALELTVADVVAMGLTPYKRAFDPDTPADLAWLDHCLTRVDATHLRHRAFATLSGGERQRVLIARALAQRADLLVLDEPTNHLDIAAQHEVLRLLRGLGLTVLAAVHDLNLALAYCDAVHVLNAGVLVASGDPAQVIEPALVEQVFGVRAATVVNPLTGGTQLVYAPLGPPPADPVPATSTGADSAR